MNNKVKGVAGMTLTALVCCIAVTSASAHHSFSAEFDPEARGEITGVITEVRFSNPHVRYRADVKNAAGQTESWELQTASVTAIAEQNWRKDSVKVGDVVKVEGQLGRNAAKKIFI